MIKFPRCQRCQRLQCSILGHDGCKCTPAELKVDAEEQYERLYENLHNSSPSISTCKKILEENGYTVHKKKKSKKKNRK